MTITIIGSGKVGASAALNSGLRELDRDVLLLDIVQGLPQGEAMDINHQLSERGSDTIVRGSNNYEDLRNSDYIVLVAGVGRKPGMTRMDLLKTLGVKKNKVMGMGGMLDLSRFKSFIRDATNISRSSIQAMVISEHGENMLPLTRFSSIGGIPLQEFISKDNAMEIFKKTRKVAAEVIALKGATVYAPGNAIATMLESAIRDKKLVIPVSTYLEGE